MPAKLINIFALSTLAILLCSFAPSQSYAVSIHGNHHLAARHSPNHHGISKKKKKRDNCKPRPSSSYPSSTPASQPTPGNDDNSGNNSDNNNNNNNNNYPPPSSSSSSSSPAVSPTPSPSTNTNTPSGPGKLAIAWAMGDDPRIQIILSSSRVKMFHLWDVVIPQSVKNSGLPVSIMLWDTSADRISNFVQYAQPGYATHAYGMNEVNEPSQGYTSVSDAISAWFSYLRPLANEGYTLGSPCTTSAPDGFDWVTQFFQDCGNDCHVDEVTIHWYDVHFEDFQTYVEKWSDAFKKPIRVTEFACQNFNGGDQPSTDDIWAFTVQAIDYLEGNGNVLSYAPFGWMDDMYNVNPADCLFVSGGVSGLGWVYLNGHE